MATRQGISRTATPGVVYDIEVDGDHLFCLANGIVTHNSHVDATLSATRSSGIFTQDLEDLGDPRGERFRARLGPWRAAGNADLPRRHPSRRELMEGWARLIERGRGGGIVVETFDTSWSDDEVLRRGAEWKETIAAVEEALA